MHVRRTNCCLDRQDGRKEDTDSLGSSQEEKIAIDGAPSLREGRLASSFFWNGQVEAAFPSPERRGKFV